MLKQMTQPGTVTKKHVPGPEHKILPAISKRPGPAAEIPPPAVLADETMPAYVARDEMRVQKWQEATPDARFLASELCKHDFKSNKTVVEIHLDFADAWHARFRKEKNGRYKRDMEFVRTGAALSPYTESQVYKILKTINVYSRDQYEQLAAAAAKNGVTVYWSHLRLIAERVGKSEFRHLRAQVEQELVRTQLTYTQLDEILKQMVPETEAESPEARTESRKQLKALLSAFRKTTNRFSDWQDALEQFEWSEDPKQAAATRREAEEAIQLLDQMTQFISENRPVLEMLAENETETPENVRAEPEETVRIARRVREQIDANKQTRRRGFSLTPDFTGDSRPVKMDRRDDDAFAGWDGPGDEDEFDALYDDPPDLPGDDDDMPDIFGENGDIPDFPTR